MIKKLFTSKITSTVSGEFAVIGLKIVDTETFHKVGIILAIASFAMLAVGLAAHLKNESATKAPVKRSRRNRRSHTSRAI